MSRVLCRALACAVLACGVLGACAPRIEVSQTSTISFGLARDVTAAGANLPQALTALGMQVQSVADDAGSTKATAITSDGVVVVVTLRRTDPDGSRLDVESSLDAKVALELAGSIAKALSEQLAAHSPEDARELGQLGYVLSEPVPEPEPEDESK